jgi:hypothetical protein
MARRSPDGAARHSRNFTPSTFPVVSSPVAVNHLHALRVRAITKISGGLQDVRRIISLGDGLLANMCPLSKAEPVPFRALSDNVHRFRSYSFESILVNVVLEIGHLSFGGEFIHYHHASLVFHGGD